MSFAAVFIALLLERFIIFDLSALRNWHWFDLYQKMLRDKLAGQSAYVLLTAYILPLIVLVAVIAVLLDSLVFGFLYLLFALVVVLYCFGPRNLWVDITTCLQGFAEGDSTSFAENMRRAFAISVDSDVQSLHRQLVTRIFVQSNNRIFAILFWFGVGGVVGAVFYRLISLLATENNADDAANSVSAKAKQILGYLDWPAARMLAFLFALGGNFSRVFACWRSKVTQGPENNDAILVECGMAALNSAAPETLPEDGSAEKEEVSVIDRSLVIMLVVLGVVLFLIP